MRTVCFLLLFALTNVAASQAFPAKPIRLIVPYPAGGTVDIVARAVAEPMSKALGQNVIVDIRVGGNTVIGTEAAVRSPGDGYTLVMIGTSLALNPLLQRVPYEAKDLAPVARLASLPFVIAVHSSVPAKSLGELVGLARSTPLNYATFGIGQLIGETFKSVASIDMNYVPYQGGVQATVSVAGGHAPVLVGPLSDATPHLVSGKLRALAVTSASRLDGHKEIPTVAESGYPGFDWTSWMGAAAPAGTPNPLIANLSEEMLRALELPETKQRFAKLSVYPAPLPPEDFERFIRTQMKNYEAVIRQAGIKAQ
jgi:tripartite-type tricarboxylate transporter receptor subunit TctC